MALYFESEIERNLPQMIANKRSFSGSVVLEEAGKLRRKEKRKKKKKDKEKDKEKKIDKVILKGKSRDLVKDKVDDKKSIP